MGVYNNDKSSPKKASAGVFHRGPLSDLKRKFSSRRYICLWVLVALVPCYVLRQMFFYQTPTDHLRKQGDTSTEKTIPYEMPKGVKLPEQKSTTDSALSAGTIKPAQYNSAPPPPAKVMENYTRNSLNLKLKANFEDDEEDFGVPEDNDKAEEQSWRAPPSPPKQVTARRSRR